MSQILILSQIWPDSAKGGHPQGPKTDLSGGFLVHWRVMTEVRDEAPPLILFLRQLHTKQFTRQGNDWAIRLISTDLV